MNIRKSSVTLILAAALLLSAACSSGTATETTTPASPDEIAAVTTAPEPEAVEVTTEAPEPEPELETALYFNDFETDLGGWRVRLGATGSAELSSVSKNGAFSLKTTGRTEEWHGSALTVDDFLGASEPYHISAWFMQDSGTDQYIRGNFQYVDAGGSEAYYNFLETLLPNGEWVFVEGDAVVPEGGTGLILYFELQTNEGGGGFAEGDFYMDDITIDGNPKAAVSAEPKNLADYYDEMIAKSLLSTGNNVRVKKAIDKARAGEDVTIAYIGGSITEGYNASPNKNCYASLSFENFKSKFGAGSDKIHLINAGMAGTPSTLGIVRYQEEVLNRAVTPPDIVFIEFAVNDGDDPTNGETYEDLIRNILTADNAPAVILVFSVFQSGLWNLQDNFIPLGEFYGLPMTSVKNAITPYIKDGSLAESQYFAQDGLHPVNDGHQIMADCIGYLFDQIDSKDASAADITLPPAIYGKSFDGLQQVNSALTPSGITVNAGGFAGKDKSTGTFQYDNTPKLPNNWKHETTSDNTPFTLKGDFKNFIFVYKSSSSDKAGKAEVYVDGALWKTIDSRNSGAWDNALVSVNVIDKTASPHTIEVKMAAGDEAKEFTILAIGVTP